MTVKSLIAKCLRKMNLEDFTSKVTADREKNLKSALICALNAVYGEIISDYLPLVAEETVTVTDKKLSGRALQKQALYPISATKDGRKIKFRTDAENIYFAEDGEIVLKYAYLPASELTEDGNVELLGASDDLLSDGMLAQYYLAAGQYDLARSYDSVYREKLWKLRYKNKDMILKERRWQK